MRQPNAKEQLICSHVEIDESRGTAYEEVDYQLWDVFTWRGRQYVLLEATGTAGESIYFVVYDFVPGPSRLAVSVFLWGV